MAKALFIPRCGSVAYPQSVTKYVETSDEIELHQSHQSKHLYFTAPPASKIVSELRACTMLAHAICQYVQQIKLNNIAWRWQEGRKKEGGSCLAVSKSDYMTFTRYHEGVTWSFPCFFLPSSLNFPSITIFVNDCRNIYPDLCPDAG